MGVSELIVHKKKCSTCHRLKPKNQFWKSKRLWGGLRGECRECEKYSNRAYIKTHKAKIYQDHQKYARLPKYRFSIAKSRAKRKNLSFDLDFSEYAELIARVCFYCGRGLNVTGCGLDRINNTKGYIHDNVVPCCKECNEIKGDSLSFEEAKVAITALTTFRKERLNGILTY